MFEFRAAVLLGWGVYLEVLVTDNMTWEGVFFISLCPLDAMD